MPSLIVRPDPAADAAASEADPAAEAPRLRRLRVAGSRFFSTHGVDAIVLLTVLVWLIPLTHRFGGRDPGAVTLGLLILIPGLVLTGAATLPKRHLVALLPGFGAALAVVFSPRRGDGLDEAALWLAAGLVYLMLAAWLRRGGNAGHLGIVVLVAGIDQFFAAWWPWFGVGDTSSLMRGTFYWHNQFAAFMIACALLATAVFLWGSGRIRVLAALAFSLSLCGTYFSGSRACLAILALGCVTAAVLSWRSWRRLLQFAALIAGAASFGWILTSSLFMPVVSVASGFAARDQSVVANGMARIEYWRSALAIVRDYPLVGTGADSFGTAGMVDVGNSATLTTLVHNGFLQAFVDGGIVLGGGVLVCSLVVLVIGVKVAWTVLRQGETPAGSWRIGAALGVGALLLHSAVDFDWSYPSLLVLTATLAAMVVSPSPSVSDARQGADGQQGVAEARHSIAAAPGGAHTAAVGLAIGIALVIGLLASGAQDSATPTSQAAGWRTVATLGVATDGGRVRVPAPIRPVSECLDDLRRWTATGPVGPAPTDLMACTADSARSDPWTVTVRASAIARSGDLARADAMAAPAVAQMSPVNAGFALVPIELALLADEPQVAAVRLEQGAELVARNATPRDLAELEQLRLQIERQLPMTTQGTSRGSTGEVGSNERGTR